MGGLESDNDTEEEEDQGEEDEVGEEEEEEEEEEDTGDDDDEEDEEEGLEGDRLTANDGNDYEFMSEGEEVEEEEEGSESKNDDEPDEDFIDDMNDFLDDEEERYERLEDKKKKMEERANKAYSLKELKGLDKNDKQDYINKILEDDVTVSHYLRRVQMKIEDENDRVIDQQQQIEDLQDDWDVEMKEINRQLIKNAQKNGITRRAYNFIEFNITDMKAKQKPRTSVNANADQSSFRSLLDRYTAASKDFNEGNKTSTALAGCGAQPPRRKLKDSYSNQQLNE